MIQAVLFDIDGVLVDSKATALHFVSDILGELDHKATHEDIEPMLHYPLVWILQKMTGRALTEELKRLPEIIAGVNYRSDLLAEFPHTKEMLKKLHDTYTLGLVTSRKKDGLKRYFDFAHTEQLFAVTVTVDEVTNHKPHPEGLLLAAKRIDVRPHECAFVGDSITDVEAAEAAGMRCILFGGKEDNRADAILSDFSQLPAIVKHL